MGKVTVRAPRSIGECTHAKRFGRHPGVSVSERSSPRQAEKDFVSN